MHMLEMKKGDIPVAIADVYGSFNPFEYFPLNEEGEKSGGAYRAGLSPSREGFQAGILMGCEVQGLLAMQTYTYQSCGNPSCEALVAFSETMKACPLCAGRYASGRHT